jgi:hypothetical protein
MQESEVTEFEKRVCGFFSLAHGSNRPGSLLAGLNNKTLSYRADF